MATQVVEFGNNVIPMGLVADGEVQTNHSTSEPSKVPTQLKHVGDRRDYQMIDPTEIVIVPGHNPRDYLLPENRAHIDALKRSIGNPKIGLLDPLKVWFNPATKRVELVDGECRLRSILELIAEGHSFKKIACFPVPQASAGTAAGRLVIAIGCNDGKSFSQWEIGGAFNTLYNTYGYSLVDIARETGKTPSFISQAMEMATAPDELKQMLSEQAVSPAEAIRVARVVTATRSLEAVQQLQATIQAKRTSGQKGPVKRAKAASSDPKAPQPTLAERMLISDMKAAILALIEGLSKDDLNENVVNEEDLNGQIYVDRIKLLKLVNFVVND